ncbi:MAG: DoxX family protein, partial [Flavitalea sp.]
PPWIPAHLAMVYISGIAESVLGILLFVPVTRIFGAWGIVVLLIVVFPANIQMLINYSNTNDSRTFIAIIRLPIQILLIWLAWIYTKRPRQQF